MVEPNQASDTGHGDERSRAPADDERTTVTHEEAVALAGRVMAAAADVAQREAAFLALVGEFDAAHASGWWDDIGSTAQWLAWSCSLAPGTAREHVRVARALRGLPVIAAAFARADLSYSKVRELTRLTGTHDEENLLHLARAATASQLARTVGAYRSCSGGRELAEQRTRVSWSNRADGLVQVTAILLPEDGATVVAALENAADEFGEDARSICSGTVTADPPATAGVTVPFDEAESAADIARRSRVSALVGLSNHWLDSQPEDRSGADRTTVVVEINAAELAATITPTAEATSNRADRQPTPVNDRESSQAVPAGTSTAPDPTSDPGADIGATTLPVAPVPARACRVRGHARLDADTARRLACEAKALAIVRGLDGEPLAVSRAKRFGTKAQRRALMLRDIHCQFAGCSRQRHLKIHHIDHWIDGGVTNLSNLLLLCQHHHTRVHQGHLRIRRGTGPTPWQFMRPDGSVIVPEVIALDLEQSLPRLCDSIGNDLPEPQRQQAELHRAQIIEHNRRHRDRVRAQQQNLTAQYNQIDSDDDPRARRLFPVGGGAGFILGHCVEVFFDSQRPGHDQGQETDLDAAA